MVDSKYGIKNYNFSKEYWSNNSKSRNANICSRSP